MPRNRVEKRPQAINDLLDAALYLAEESGSEELAFIEVVRVLHAKRDIESVFTDS